MFSVLAGRLTGRFVAGVWAVQCVGAPAGCPGAVLRKWPGDAGAGCPRHPSGGERGAGAPALHELERADRAPLHGPHLRPRWCAAAAAAAAATHYERPLPPPLLSSLSPAPMRARQPAGLPCVKPRLFWS
jgi:hypothetical protein